MPQFDLPEVLESYGGRIRRKVTDVNTQEPLKRGVILREVVNGNMYISTEGRVSPMRPC